MVDKMYFFKSFDYNFIISALLNTFSGGEGGDCKRYID